jgi:aminoglycoside 6'-N-acetyltransferase
MPGLINFQHLTAADYPQLYHWLHNPEVARWWDSPSSLVGVAKKYDPQNPENSDLRSYVIFVDEVPIGYVQAYDGRDPNTVGIDLLIGEDSHRHRGLGARIITTFVRELVFSTPAIARCIVDPTPENAIAIAAYRKAGFSRARIQPDPKYVFMELNREEFIASEARRGERPRDRTNC